MSRQVRPLATVMALALLATGCSTGSEPRGSDGGTPRYEKAMKFSACMRTNGVGEFPYPNASGSLTLEGVVNTSSLDPGAPAWKAAIAKCKKLEPAGFTKRPNGA